jgi:LacI family transcriptional regulator
MSTRKPTVSDIARHLDISPSTVSRVLTGSQLVKEETRQRIEAAAAELGYTRRRIRRHGARSILTTALFIPRSSDVYHRLFYDPAELVAGLTAGFGEVRTQISVSVNEPNPELFTSKKSGNIDACVFGFTTPSDDVATLLREREIPTVLLNRETPRGNYVATDHLAGMRALLQRAVSTARDVRPCYVSFTPARPVAASRERAFLEACCAEGIGCGSTDVFPISSVREIDGAFLDRISERYNTVFCFNDFVAVYLYQVALITGRSVPEDLAIAGYDDSPVRQLTPQPIDTISLSPYRLGHEAGRWLRRVVIQRSTEPLQLLVPGDLVPGTTLIRTSGPCGKNSFDIPSNRRDNG